MLTRGQASASRGSLLACDKIRLDETPSVRCCRLPALVSLARPLNRLRVEAGHVFAAGAVVLPTTRIPRQSAFTAFPISAPQHSLSAVAAFASAPLPDSSLDSKTPAAHSRRVGNRLPLKQGEAIRSRPRILSADHADRPRERCTADPPCRRRLQHIDAGGRSIGRLPIDAGQRPSRSCLTPRYAPTSNHPPWARAFVETHCSHDLTTDTARRKAISAALVSARPRPTAEIFSQASRSQSPRPHLVPAPPTARSKLRSGSIAAPSAQDALLQGHRG